jgi:hypothetical protein
MGIAEVLRVAIAGGQTRSRNEQEGTEKTEERMVDRSPLSSVTSVLSCSFP